MDTNDVTAEMWDAETTLMELEGQLLDQLEGLSFNPDCDTEGNRRAIRELEAQIEAQEDRLGRKAMFDYAHQAIALTHAELPDNGPF